MATQKNNLGFDFSSDVSDTDSSISEKEETVDDNSEALDFGKDAFRILGAYMKADAIRKSANYEADILQLNADLGLFEAFQQRGVDMSKILRAGEQVESLLSETRAEFARLGQQGGAATDLIKQNQLQGQLNILTMMNEAQARVSSAEFQRSLAYLKAQNMRDISEAQGRQAVLAGFINAGFDVSEAVAKAGAG